LHVYDAYNSSGNKHSPNGPVLSVANQRLKNMAVHLLSLLASQFTPAVIDRLGAELAEQPDAIRKAADGAVPTLLGALTRRIQATGGASSVVSLLSGDAYRDAPFDVSQVLDSPDETRRAATVSEPFLAELFGDQLDRTNELLSIYSGTKPASSHTVLGLAASVLMGVLGRQEDEKGLSAHNLETLLLGQATEFRKALPSGLDAVGSILDFDALQTPTGPQTEVQGTDNFSGTIINPNIPKSPEGDRRLENVRWLRWAMVAMGILVAALIIQKCTQNESSTEGISTDSTARVESDAVEDTSAATKQSVREANGQVDDSTASGALGMRNASAGATNDGKDTAAMPDVMVQTELPGGRKLTLGQRSFTNLLARFIASKPKNPARTFTFDGLTFETGSARITTASQPEVNNLIEIMKAYPDLRIRIEGHTDNTGNPDTNRELSLSRANAVKSALSAAGIADVRVTTRGYGATKPTASNETETGQQRNRRIDVAIVNL